MEIDDWWIRDQNGGRRPSHRAAESSSKDSSRHDVTCHWVNSRMKPRCHSVLRHLTNNDMKQLLVWAVNQVDQGVKYTRRDSRQRATRDECSITALL